MSMMALQFDDESMATESGIEVRSACCNAFYLVKDFTMAKVSR